MGERLPQGPLKLSEFLSPRIPPGRSGTSPYKHLLWSGLSVGRSSSLEGEINENLATPPIYKYAIHFLHRERNEMKGDATTNTADK